MAIDPHHIDTEVLPLLSHQSRMDVRCLAMQYFLGLTGTQEGREFIAGNDKYLTAILSLLDDIQEAIAKDAFDSLVNLTTEDHISQKLLELKSHPNLPLNLLKYIVDKDSPHADTVCKILSNSSRPEVCAAKYVDVMMENDDSVGFDRIIYVFCQDKYNTKNSLHYIGPFLSNLTQITRARTQVMDKQRCVVHRLLPFVDFKGSAVRRSGIISVLRNCCFEVQYHCWLLSDEIDILPRLLLPLAGPEEFDEEDTGKLPPDLQYLEPDKQREADPVVRKLLVEAIHQLCATRVCRDRVKAMNTYVILRELHKWENNPAAIVATENLVSLLISDEPEGENLRDVDIPKDVEEKLKKLDLDVEKQIETDLAEMEAEQKPDQSS